MKKELRAKEIKADRILLEKTNKENAKLKAKLKALRKAPIS